jgi:putative metalloprotease
MIDFSGQNAMRTVLAVTLNRFIPFIGPWIANMAVNMVAAGMSRKDEFEADSYATALMIKAGLGVAPQKSLFTKLNKLTANNGSTPAWFLSHPKTSDRIKAIEANEMRWTGTVS